MKHLLLILAIMATVAAFLPQQAVSANKETAKVEEALTVLNQISAIPEKSIPPWLLKDAYGVAVIPDVIKAGFIVGGRYGWGVLSVQTKTGEWSAPIFVSLTGGSVGYQAGVEATDVVLVFKDSNSITKITTGKFTLGADASVAAGPVGRAASGGTEANLKSAIYSYSRSRGLFAGVALEGSVLEVDYDADAAFYGKAAVPETIFSGKATIPPVAQEFRGLLTKIEK